MSLTASALRSTPCRLRVVLVRRSFATESMPSSSNGAGPTSTSSSDGPPPGLPLTSKQKSTSKPRLYPHPRPAVSHRHGVPNLPKLPPTFGRNQMLPVSNSTRALLESIVSKFDAPIRYAFAYGSGVFEQDGYASTSPASASSTTDSTTPSGSALSLPGASKSIADRPMLDFMFAVTHPGHFHSINMQQNPSHYPLHARLLGSDYVSRVQEFGPGVWFNAYVPMNDVVSNPLYSLCHCEGCRSEGTVMTRLERCPVFLTPMYT